MIEHFSVPTEQGENQLAHKIAAIKAGRMTIIKVIPDVPIHGGHERGWDIQAENGVEPYRSTITGEMVYEM